jgi:hypothetical protein
VRFGPCGGDGSSPPLHLQQQVEVEEEEDKGGGGLQDAGQASVRRGAEQLRSDVLRSLVTPVEAELEIRAGRHRCAQLFAHPRQIRAVLDSDDED